MNTPPATAKHADAACGIGGLGTDLAPLTPSEAVSALVSARPALRAFLASLLADELHRLTGRTVPVARELGWCDDTLIGEDGLGFDSLALMNSIARFTQVFDLSRTGVEDYFLTMQRLGAWTDLVALHYDLLSETKTRHAPSAAEAGDPTALVPSIAFQSSGSTGAPSIARHSLAALAEEMIALAPLFDGARRVVALVPPRHIFGFLYAILLPPMLRLDREDLRQRGPATVIGALRDGDIVVATPHIWESLAAAGARMAPGVRGITSGAPAPDRLWAQLGAAGLETLIEIYGATETSGVGWRSTPNSAFALMPHLMRSDGEIRRTSAPERPLPTQDILAWDDEGRFRPAGRKDKMIQIGGTNVSTAAIRRSLQACAGVGDAAVRADGTSATARLKAFIVPQDPQADLIALERALRESMRAAHLPAERPQRYRFGDALPVTELGKPADWP